MASIKALFVLIVMPTVSGARCAHLLADWTSRSTAMGQADQYSISHQYMSPDLWFVLDPSSVISSSILHADLEKAPFRPIGLHLTSSGIFHLLLPSGK